MMCQVFLVVFHCIVSRMIYTEYYIEVFCMGKGFHLRNCGYMKKEVKVCCMIHTFYSSFMTWTAVHMTLAPVWRMAEQVATAMGHSLLAH